MQEQIDNDDVPVGRVLTRRDAILLLGGLGAGGLLWLAGCSGSDTTGTTDTGDGGSSLDCAVKPALTEGPYYVDENLTRSDIRADSSTGVLQEGALFALTFNVSQIASSACTPLAGAIVDLWHCNALGLYSDTQDPGFNTVGQDWLRGNQLTDVNGTATFTTIFPGWYSGRATHIHFKIRSAASASSTYEFTSQLFFDEIFLSSLYTQQAPYTTKGDSGRLRNASDGIYNQGGSELLLTPTASGSGYAAAINIGMDVSA
jgi:protocatechuate 3,4-dioxygenase beta subunit